MTITLGVSRIRKISLFSLFISFLLFFSASPGAWGQTIQVGSDSEDNWLFPIHYLYSYNYTQTIYTKSEINTGGYNQAGKITKIYYKPIESISTAKWRDWVIYMGNTSKTGFSSVSDYISPAAMTMVFNGQIIGNTTAHQWMEIVLQTPFEWNGTDNLVVSVQENTPDWGGDTGWRAYDDASGSGYKGIQFKQDGGVIDPWNPYATYSGGYDRVAYIQLEFEDLTPCTGTPAGGTAVLNPDSGEPGSQVNGHVTGSSTGSGLEYQWQISTTGTGGWSNISGQTGANLNTTAINDLGVRYYRRRIECTHSGGSAVSTIATYTTVPCIPPDGNCLGDNITSVELETLIDTGLGCNPRYENRSSSQNAIPDLEQDESHSMSVGVGNGGTEYVGVWIDFNQNGIFDTNEFFNLGSGNNTTVTGNISIPGTALPGNTMMRVRTKYGSVFNPWEACEQVSYGTTRDYTVNIVQGASCRKPMMTTASDIRYTAAVLNWLPPEAGSAPPNYEVQWSTSSNFSGSSSHTLNALKHEITGLTPNTVYYYRVRSKCGGSFGNSHWSSVESFTTGSFTPLTLTGYNVDVVANIGRTVFSSTDASMDGSGYCMAEINYSNPYGTSFRGLPTNRVIINSGSSAPDPAGIKYLLQDYTKKNVLKLKHDENGGAGTYNLTVNMPISELFFAIASTEGAGHMQIEIEYTTGASQFIDSESIADWTDYWGGSYIYEGDYRVSRTDEQFEFEEPKIRQMYLTGLDSNRIVRRINFVNSNSPILNVFAVSAQPEWARTTSATADSVCKGEEATISINGADHTKFRIYEEGSGGSPIATVTGTWEITPTATTTYYIAAINDSFAPYIYENPTRVPVTVVVEPSPNTVSITATQYPETETYCFEYTKLEALGGEVEIHQTDVILTEDFNNSGPALPSGWTSNGTFYHSSQYSYGNEWPEEPRGYDNTGYCVYFNSYLIYSGNKGYLQSPSIDLSDYASAELTFYIYNNSGTDVLDVFVNKNGGAYTQINPAPYEQYTDWTKITLDLSAYTGPGNNSIRLRFQGTSDYGWSNIALDEVYVTGTKILSEHILTWSPTAGLYTDDTLTIPYTGGHAEVVYAAPVGSETYTVKAGSSLSSCSTADVNVVTNHAVQFTGNSNNNWNRTNNWFPKAIPDIDQCVNVPSGKTLNVNVNDAEAKSVFVANGGEISIGGGRSLTVLDFITNEGNGDNFVVKDGGNLIQINDAVNTGEITTEHNMKYLDSQFPNKYDYVYWSSPVENQILKGSGGFSPGTPIAHQSWGFLEYNESNDYFDNTGDTRFEIAKGYAIGAETDQPGNYYSKTYTFKGVPHNGDKPFTLSKSGQGYNLTGNPYPSNIDIEKVWDDNEDILSIVWLWTNNKPEPHQYGAGYSQNNYGIYTRIGGTPPSYDSQAPGGGNGTYQITQAPNGIIRSGQGFIVEAKDGRHGRPLTFKNSHRVNDSEIFFQKELKDRYWLTLTSPSKIVNTTLIGYVSGATNGYDPDYDAPFWGASDGIYSIIPEGNTIIQGRQHPLDIRDVVQLGTQFYEDGVYIITLQKAEGTFNDTKVYLVDKELGYTHNLSKEPYKFFTFSGTFDERFEIRYRKSGFSTSAEANFITAAVQKEDIIILSTLENIKEVQLFDILGMEVYQNVKVDGKELRIPAAKWMNDILFARIITEGGKVTTTKVLLK